MDLLLCPDCSRQYDVTGLEAGDRVRCRCDQVLSVPLPESLSIRAFYCTNCAGVVSKEDEQCPYCNAGLSEKDREHTTVCPSCYARFGANAKHCPGCGLPILPTALLPLPEEHDCPRCTKSLQVRSLGAMQVVECSSCEGLWMKMDDLEALCTDAERRLESAIGSDPSKLTEPESPENVRYIPCLQCRQLMLRRQFRWGGRTTGIIVDFCRDHGMWLDNTELERISAFIRTRGGGAQPGHVGETIGGRPTAPAKPRFQSKPGHLPLGSGSSSTVVESVIDFLGNMLSGRLG